MMREMVLTAASLALTGAVVANAYYQKHQFYPSVVYLTKSSPSMAVLYLQAFVFVILLGKFIRKVFFGQLRAAEMEHLIERSWYAVTETCLAFTVFRDDFSPRFVAQFTLLLFVKCFHWLAEDRIDYMERSPVLSWLFHSRAVTLLMFLGMVDSFLVHIAYNTTITSGASVQLVFGFEYAILLTIVATIFMKYTLHVIDLQSENPWDNKAVYLLYTELIMGFIKAVLYVCFVAIMIKVHTFPLFAIRPMYLTLRGFKKSLSDVIMSRRAISNMNTLYPDATPEELSQGDNVCIICREEMTTACKKIPCNHIFHASCLRSWFQRQQTCPTCRMDVLRPMPRPQPPPAQPPVQPQMPPGMPNGAQMMPPYGMYPGWPPMGMPPMGMPPMGMPPQLPGQQQMPGTEQTPTAATSTGTTPTTTTAQPPSSGAFNQMSSFGMPPPPFMMPPPFAMPPPMFGMPFIPPPTAPGADLTGLSAEELRNLEGQERQNLESRIALIRSVHMLLDMAVSQLNQYTMMVNTPSNPAATPASAPTQQPTVSAQAPTASTQAPTASTSTPEPENKPSDWPSLSNVSVPPAVPSATPTPVTPESNENAQPEVASEAATSMEPETVGSTEPTDAEENQASNEIRRRRLERFTKEENKTEGEEQDDKESTL